MEIILGILILLFFLSINFCIIRSDYTINKISNTLLVYLLFFLPVWYLYALYFQYINHFWLSNFFLHIIYTFLISFFLFYFSILWASISKYLFILSLYIFPVTIFTYLWNIFLSFLFIILIHFIYTLISLWWYKQQSPLSLRAREVIIWFKERWSELKYHTIIFYIIGFLWFFICMRVIRFYVLQYVDVVRIITRFQEDLIFRVLIIGSIFVIVAFIFRILPKIRKIFRIKSIKYCLYIVTIIILISLIIIDPQETLFLIKQIFLYYLCIYIIIKLLMKSYKEVFKLQEYYFIDARTIKVWTLLDTEFLKEYKLKYFNISYIQSKWITIPKTLIKRMKHAHFMKELTGKYYEIKARANLKSLKKELKIIEDVVRLYKKKDSDIEESYKIKVVKTLCFSPYIFIWCIISLLWFSIIHSIIDFVIYSWIIY